MENKDYVSVLREMLIAKVQDENNRKAKKQPQGIIKMVSDQGNALSYALSLAKDYEQARSGLLEEKDIPPSESFEDVSDPQCSFERGVIAGNNEMIHQVALGMVKFKKRLPEIIWDNIQVILQKDTSLKPNSAEEIEEILAKGEIDKKLSQAILSEMGVGE